MNAANPFNGKFDHDRSYLRDNYPHPRVIDKSGLTTITLDHNTFEQLFNSVREGDHAERVAKSYYEEIMRVSLVERNCKDWLNKQITSIYSENGTVDQEGYGKVHDQFAWALARIFARWKNFNDFNTGMNMFRANFRTDLDKASQLIKFFLDYPEPGDNIRDGQKIRKFLKDLFTNLKELRDPAITRTVESLEAHGNKDLHNEAIAEGYHKYYSKLFFLVIVFAMLIGFTLNKS